MRQAYFFWFYPQHEENTINHTLLYGESSINKAPVNQEQSWSGCRRNSVLLSINGWERGNNTTPPRYRKPGSVERKVSLPGPSYYYTTYMLQVSGWPTVKKEAGMLRDQGVIVYLTQTRHPMEETLYSNGSRVVHQWSKTHLEGWGIITRSVVILEQIHK